MSVTTTANPVTTSVITLLADYDVLHTDSLSGGTAPAPNEREDLTQMVRNPPKWPTNHRRVPPYRPIDRTLDMSDRPAGSNTVEQIFITVMLNGVRVTSIANSMWRSTGEKVNKNLFRTKVGGEW